MSCFNIQSYYICVFKFYDLQEEFIISKVVVIIIEVY